MKKKKWLGHVPYMGDRRVAYRVFFVRPERKKPRRKLEENIKMYLDKFGWKVMNWIVMAEYRDRWWALVNAVMNLRDQ
jgi:hypothetical protein